MVVGYRVVQEAIDRLNNSGYSDKTDASLLGASGRLVEGGETPELSRYPRTF